MSDNAMLGKGRAVQCRAMIQEGRAVKENITSGQSGDCLIYLGLFIYMEVCTWTMHQENYTYLFPYLSVLEKQSYLK